MPAKKKSVWHRLNKAYETDSGVRLTASEVIELVHATQETIKNQLWFESMAKTLDG